MQNHTERGNKESCICKNNGDLALDGWNKCMDLNCLNKLTNDFVHPVLWRYTITTIPLLSAFVKPE